MDAFLQRKLFAHDVIAYPGHNEVDLKIHALVKAHGGAVVDDFEESSDLATVVLVSVPAQDEMIKHLTKRYPKAEIVCTKWVTDSLQKNRRLGLAPYRLWKPLINESPPSKRSKIATSSVAFFTAQKTTTISDVTFLEPNFMPWRTVQNSLHVLDARAKQEQDVIAKSYKIAAFDLDGTLIVTKSGKKFAKDIDDWKWFHATLVKAKLTELAREGYTLAIFSNQNGIAKGHVTASQVQRKVETIVKQLKLPMLVFLSAENDIMRKPRLGAWTEMTKLVGAKSELFFNKDASFYCGDAAGRPKVSERAKDFAATDYKFALNAGIRFYTPEYLFLDSKQHLHTHSDTWELGFNPKSIAVNNSGEPALSPHSAQASNTNQEMIILVGSPASGKSFFAKKYLDSYVAVSQDELRTVANCKKTCLEAIEQKKSVVIDNTNRDPRARKEWIAIAQEKNIPARCFVMDVDKPLSMHLNTFRALTKQKSIPPIAIHGFYKNFVTPTMKEGFKEIIKVQFRVDGNLPEADQTLLRSYL